MEVGNGSGRLGLGCVTGRNPTPSTNPVPTVRVLLGSGHCLSMPPPYSLCTAHLPTPTPLAAWLL
jgi:hypothetical protein